MTGFDWVDIPAGAVYRGTPAADIDGLMIRYAGTGVPRAWFEKEVPRSRVEVAAFRLARVPVTVGDWIPYARATSHPIPDDPVDHPVVGVSWQAASDYCAWMTSETGSPVRLPTEKEWERAARGDDAREHPWGDEYRTGLANLVDLGLGTTCPVGRFPEGASPFGVLDMAGNVDEWTATPYAPYPGAPATVARTETWAFDRHITRGGSYRHDRDLARCARRHGAYESDLRRIGVGLRLAAAGVR